MGLVGRQDLARSSRRKASVAVSKPAPLSSTPRNRRFSHGGDCGGTSAGIFAAAQDRQTRYSPCTLLPRGWQNYCIAGLRRQTCGRLAYRHGVGLPNRPTLEGGIMEITRNQFFMAGLVLLFLGLQFRAIDSVELKEQCQVHRRTERPSLDQRHRADPRALHTRRQGPRSHVPSAGMAGVDASLPRRRSGLAQPGHAQRRIATTPQGGAASHLTRSPHFVTMFIMPVLPSRAYRDVFRPNSHQESYRCPHTNAWR